MQAVKKTVRETRNRTKKLPQMPLRLHKLENGENFPAPTFEVPPKDGS